MCDPTEIRDEFLMLWSKGHAVLLDDTFDCTGKLIRTKIHHYKTCVRCKAMEYAKFSETTDTSATCPSPAPGTSS